MGHGLSHHSKTYHLSQWHLHLKFHECPVGLISLIAGTTGGPTFKTLDSINSISEYVFSMIPVPKLRFCSTKNTLSYLKTHIEEPLSQFYDKQPLGKLTTSRTVFLVECVKSHETHIVMTSLHGELLALSACRSQRTVTFTCSAWNRLVTGSITEAKRLRHLSRNRNFPKPSPPCRQCNSHPSVPAARSCHLLSFGQVKEPDGTRTLWPAFQGQRVLIQKTSDVLLSSVNYAGLRREKTTT